MTFDLRFGRAERSDKVGGRMAEPRKFDGSEDAPLARGTLCADCGELRSHWNHNVRNPKSHFFNTGRPVIADRDTGPKTPKAPHSIEELYGDQATRADRVDHSKRYKKVRHIVAVHVAERVPDPKPGEPSGAGRKFCCTICGKPKLGGFHRGRGSHTFTTEPIPIPPIDVPARSSLSAAIAAVGRKEPELADDARAAERIASDVETALRAIGSRIRIRSITVEPEYSNDGAEMVTARVQVALSVVFPRGEEAA
jgi:hypothetical protein